MQIAYNADSHGPQTFKSEMGTTANSNAVLTETCFMKFSGVSWSTSVDRQEI